MNVAPESFTSPRAQLQKIYELLNEPAPPSRDITGTAKRLVKAGWAHRCDIEDTLWAMDARFDLSCTYRLVGALSEALKIPTRSVCYRPKARQVNAVTFGCMAVADLTSIMMLLERLGFQIDATPFVKLLMPAITKQGMITDSELSVLWYADERHKHCPVALQSAEDEAERAALVNSYLWAEGGLTNVSRKMRPGTEEKKLPNGYRIRTVRATEGHVMELVAYPHVRRKLANHPIKSMDSMGFRIN